MKFRNKMLVEEKETTSYCRIAKLAHGLVVGSVTWFLIHFYGPS